MSIEFFRHVPLFAELPEVDLEWLSEQAEPISLQTGDVLLEEGSPGNDAYIVLDGEFEVVKKSDVQNIVIAVRDPGEVIGEMALLDQAPRMATVRAVRDSKVLKIRGEIFHQLVSQKPSAAMAVLHTVSKRLRQNEALLRQSEKMAALGTLSAGLAHELNNPASAVRRSADQLRSEFLQWAELSVDLNRLDLTADQIEILNGLKVEIENHGAAPNALDPLTQNDRETELQTRLEAWGAEDAWELAPALVSFGWDLPSLEKLPKAFETPALRLVLKWLAAGSTVFSLIHEISIGAGRISEIVKSVKAYTFLDQAPVQQVDVHEGLENTLIILRHKTKEGVKITRDYDTHLPQIEAHGTELNQVWTNIIDNAVDAMQGKGELTLHTYLKNKNVVVEIQDTGPGIPPEIQQRIFEPFFTTKPPGSGTGLGLHIAYTIVNNHYGQIRLQSAPGKTVFQVTLPLQLPR
jgi:signal transduction histidine kinase